MGFSYILENLILSTSLELELIAGQVVKSILVCLLLALIGYNLYRFIKNPKRIWYFILIIILAIPIYPVSTLIIKDYHLLFDYEIVEGEIVGDCETYGSVAGIEFKYSFEGKDYKACNSIFPIKKTDLEIPGGKHLVRVPKKNPSRGVMEFVARGK